MPDSLSASAPSGPPAPNVTEILFETLPIPTQVLKGLDAAGFAHCTPIQAKTLPLLLQGHDVAGQAQTGTGKTAAFLVSIFTELLETDRDHPTAARAVIVAPTRELALQIASDADKLGKYCYFKTVAVFGGMDWEKQAKQLEGAVDIVVGTPGRMMDYMKRGLLDLRHVQSVVIDEADRMFDMGFVDDIRFILRHTPTDRQTCLFSATLTYDVMNLAQRYMHEPVEVRIEPEKVTAEGIEQQLFHVAEKEKLSLLLWLLEQDPPRRALVFVNQKRTGEYVQFKLWHNGWESEYMSGDVAQKKRLRLVEEFKAGKIEVLVATDVAARGLHIDHVDLVVNWDVPQDAEDYVHRIGRTGRAGEKGRAIMLCDEHLCEYLPAIEKYIGGKVPATFPEAHMRMDVLGPSFKHSAQAEKRRRTGRRGAGGGGGGGGFGGGGGGGFGGGRRRR
ncbi:MAG: DEAD/DEAH box helicase [Myxococcales bacterium]|nr:DEAD/DEAH box helicase [Myxococcales bacterium]